MTRNYGRTEHIEVGVEGPRGISRTGSLLRIDGSSTVSAITRGNLIIFPVEDGTAMRKGALTVLSHFTIHDDGVVCGGVDLISHHSILKAAVRRRH